MPISDNYLYTGLEKVLYNYKLNQDVDNKSQKTTD